MDISNQWKHIMLTLPDNYFFELMRNYLGKIETPFNKHKLVDRLAAFLVKQDAEDKILNNLEEKEILILTSVEFIQMPTAKSIYEFFLGDIPFIELCDILKTLEEKLIIYSDSSVIYISPLFGESVKKSIVNPGLLYKSEKITPGSGSIIWLSDSLLLSFLSMLIHQKDLIKSSGAFKKRAYNKIEDLYPSLFRGETGQRKLELVRKIIHNLKLFRIDGNSLIPREEIWEQLMSLSQKNTWLYMVSAGTIESNNSLGDRITTVKRIIETIPKDRSFYPDNLKKLIKAVSCDKSLNGNVVITEFIDDLISMNILIPLENGTITLNPILDLNNLNPDYGDYKTVILQPNFDITYKPWINIRDGYIVAIFADLKKMDIYTELVITKESVIRGLTLSTLDEFKTVIQRVSGVKIQDNIIMTLDEWEKESIKARHYEASVLILDNDKDYILRETGVIEDYILLNPAKGIYLIKPEDYKQVKLLLEKVDIIPLDKNHSDPLESISLPEFKNSAPINIDWQIKDIKKGDSDKVSLERFIREVSANKDEVEDLKKRISRGIIFTKEQIKSGISKTDFSEAKGINYQGKLRLIEVSLKSTNDRLEINYVEDLSIKKELILPEKLEKEGDKRILHGLRLPQEQPFSIDISKISLVKRIQTTLF